MAGLFHNLGRMAGPHVRKAKWFFRSLTGSPEETIEAEYEVGRDMALALEAEGQIDGDPMVRQVLADVGGRLAGRLANRQRRFRFEGLNDSQVNAFALPGGFIFVTRPLLELCAPRLDELAFVLGHEMAHVVRGHAMNRMVSGAVLSAASRASLAARMLNRRLLDAALAMVQQAYSREQELEADQFAVRLMLSAELDPAAGIDMLRKLNEQGGDMGGLASYFSTHPAMDLRMAEIRRLLKERGA